MEYYNQLYQRNLGIFTEDEQMRIKELSVGIAGVGGVGGAALIDLARMGVQNFTIADPDNFEFSNFNRQEGAYVSTLGKNKCEVLSDIVLSINPEINIEVFSNGINEDNLISFINKVDVVVDGLDFFCLKLRKNLISQTVLSNKYVFGAPIMGFGCSLYVFAPGGTGFEDYFGSIPERPSAEFMIHFGRKLFPKIPEYIDVKEYVMALNSARPLPSLATSCSLSGSMLAVDLILCLIKNKTPVIIPEIKQLDLYDSKYIIS